MKSYVVYEPGTGEIVRWGRCQDADLDLLLTNERAIEADASPITHYVSNGAVVAYTPEQAALKQGRPNPFCLWSNAAMQWGDTRSLDVLRASKWVEVKQARDAAEFGGFTWGGSVFDSDEISQSRIQGATQLAQLLGQSFSVEWTLADNSVRVLNDVDMLAVGTVMGAHIVTAHSTGRALREQINVATTIEELEGIQWP